MSTSVVPISLRPTIGDVYDYQPGDISAFGPFGAMLNNPNTGLKFPGTEFDLAMMDIEYLTNVSAQKITSPLVRSMLIYPDPSAITLSTEARYKISAILLNRFSRKWTQLYNAYMAEYSQLDPYHITETSMRTTSGTEALQHGHSKSGTDTITFGHVIDNTGKTEYGHDVTTTDNRTDYTFGFNTTDENPVPASKSEVTSSETNGGEDNTMAKTTNSGTDSTTHSESNSGTDTTTRNGSDDFSLTRTGSLGNHTAQELLESDWAFWQKDFLAIVYRDVDSVLALSVY